VFSSLATTFSRSATTRSMGTVTTSSSKQTDNRSIVTTAPASNSVLLDEGDIPFSQTNFQELWKLGSLCFSSASSDSQLGLDWSLIGFDETGIKKAQKASQSSARLASIILPKRVAASPEYDSTIVVLKGHGVISRGSISASTTMMRLPHDKRFQEVWTIRLDSPLSKLKNSLISSDVLTEFRRR
jgi:hypothetical protein